MPFNKEVQANTLKKVKCTILATEESKNNLQQFIDRSLSIMRSIDRKKLNTEAVNILSRNNHIHIYEMWEYDTSNFDLNNNKNTTKLNNRITGNEILASCLMVALLSISFGGSYLIRNRTQQKLIYSSSPQVSSSIRQ